MLATKRPLEFTNEVRRLKQVLPCRDTPSSNAPTTPAGGSICPAPRSGAAGAPRAVGPAQPAKASIHDRPAHIASRQTPGHWEADTMLFSAPGADLLLVHALLADTRGYSSPRHSPTSRPTPPPTTSHRYSNPSRQTCASPPPSTMGPSSHDISGAPANPLSKPGSVTHTPPGKKAAPGKRAAHGKRAPPPRRKSGGENPIGRLRRALPRKTTITAWPQQRLNAIIAAYTNTPRKCLKYHTPAKTFTPLHFHWETTPASSPEWRGQ